MLNNSRQDKRLAAIKQSRNRQDALAGLSQVAHHGAIAVRIQDRRYRCDVEERQ
ncbi:hypothetical protein DSM3645_28147 [Blastopirellula marina DSM 3645]|uniref:Uncharacterized protein n=1 Tax=Blastopirellula marina DSM 3645 TaxID=314230 RepID=A3ZP55_9BACT|nr:hypothetical protein DSM3645_28147 [Blastopirellula marina DSM 3645]